jgi:hypothetical protein
MPPLRERRPEDSTLRKSLARRRDRKSDGEAFASFTTAGGEHGPTGAGLHSVTEAVTALPPAHLGLIRSFHEKFALVDRRGATCEGYGGPTHYVKGARHARSAMTAVFV